MVSACDPWTVFGRTLTVSGRIDAISAGEHGAKDRITRRRAVRRADAYMRCVIEPRARSRARGCALVSETAGHEVSET